VTLNDLDRHEWRVSSQNGEDGVLTALFTAVGVTNHFFVEFGCSDATECNTAFLLAQGGAASSRTRPASRAIRGPSCRRNT